MATATAPLLLPCRLRTSTPTRNSSPSYSLRLSKFTIPLPLKCKLKRTPPVLALRLFRRLEACRSRWSRLSVKLRLRSLVKSRLLLPLRLRSRRASINARKTIGFKACIFKGRHIATTLRSSQCYNAQKAIRTSPLSSSRPFRRTLPLAFSSLSTLLRQNESRNLCKGIIHRTIRLATYPEPSIPKNLEKIQPRHTERKQHSAVDDVQQVSLRLCSR